jgi:acetyl-CoA carboxylase biotin carboxylase subunit
MKRILIANRGEIAIRVAKAVRELGHIAIGIWTDNEPQASHLEYCHEWVHLPGTTNQETFLNMPAIMNLIKDHKVDAVHPGYGFLSENTEFCKLLDKNKVTFIGPHPKAIEKMGDKAVSKTIASKQACRLYQDLLGKWPVQMKRRRLPKILSIQCF